jgi:hypothetical protein
MSTINQKENEVVIGEVYTEGSELADGVGGADGADGGEVDMMQNLLTERMKLLEELNDPSLLISDRKWVEKDISNIEQQIAAFQKLY